MSRLAFAEHPAKAPFETLANWPDSAYELTLTDGNNWNIQVLQFLTK
jgi:hypothetical protein